MSASRVDVAVRPMTAPVEGVPGVGDKRMRNLILTVAVAGLVALAGWNGSVANAQYGYGHSHGHSHCDGGYGVGYGAGYGTYVPGHVHVYRGYSSGLGGYSAGYGSYRGVPPIVLGQIYTGGSPLYGTLPYSRNFGGFYGSGYSGMGYSNFGTGMGVGYGPSISIGIGGFRPRF